VVFVVEINDGHLRRESRPIHSFIILKSTQTTLRRIHREISDLKKEDLGEISVGPVSNDNPFLWRARIPGPEGSVYEGGMFNVEIMLNHDYPCVLFPL
jgi:ubiquitin-protein ligase